MASSTYPNYDILIIGSGAAGLMTALHLADYANIAILTKSRLKEGSTAYAQGGISAVLDKEDSLQSHIKDTLDAGAGLCHKKIVKKVVAEGKSCIDQLIQQGVKFSQTQDGKHYHLTREGGHSHRRVIHAADATGNAVETTLAEQVKQHPNITIYSHHLAIDLITKKTKQTQKTKQSKQCLGAYVFNNPQQKVFVIPAKFTILATGGASKVYLYTSNPDVSTGDGIAMAWRAGCRVANMEFIQFHPTCLYHPEARSFLISEAVRGEGGKLILPNGQRFMPRFDPRAELAPRDIVARAIDHEMKRLGIESVYLDISHESDRLIRTHFPTIYSRCLDFGMDITKEPIPVVPAAHYTCGGVMTDKHAKTDIKNLYAIGETAFTGLHGANRMASNSLLECLAFAKFASDNIKKNLDKVTSPSKLPIWDESQVTDSDEEVVVAHNWEELRRFMWDYVGIVRTNKRLARAKRRCDVLQQEIYEYYGHFRVSHDLLELRNLVTVADLIIQSALRRHHSVGLHYTLDDKGKKDPLYHQNTILLPNSL